MLLAHTTTRLDPIPAQSAASPHIQYVEWYDHDRPPSFSSNSNTSRSRPHRLKSTFVVVIVAIIPSTYNPCASFKSLLSLFSTTFAINQYLMRYVQSFILSYFTQELGNLRVFEEISNRYSPTGTSSFEKRHHSS